MRLDLKKAAALVSLLILALAWIGGSLRQEKNAVARLESLSAEVTDIRQVGDALFEGRKKNDPQSRVFIGVQSRPGYGGPLTVAVMVNDSGLIEKTAILHSTDTSTYLTKIVGQGLLKAFPGREVDDLPEVDAVSGATISSTAIIEGLTRALTQVGHEKFGRARPESSSRSFPSGEWPKLLAIFLLFGAAWYVSSQRFPWNKKWARWGIMLAALIAFGFAYGCQFSLSTVTLFLGGSWLKGLATFGPFLVLGLAVLVFFVTRKNLYCATLCPFGVLQEGLSRITGCSPPPVSPWMTWAARGFALLVMSAALYFRDPSRATYEPFGMAFNFIGSSALFVLTILVVLSSMVFKRPWCRLLCPIGCLFDYFQFIRNTWLNPRKRSSRKELQA